MSRFETEILIQPKNLEFLMDLPGIWVRRCMSFTDNARVRARGFV